MGVHLSGKVQSVGVGEESAVSSCHSEDCDLHSSVQLWLLSPSVLKIVT